MCFLLLFLKLSDVHAWRKPILPDGSFAIALYYTNIAGGPSRVSVRLADIGLTTSARYQVTEAFSGRSYGIMKPWYTLNCEVNPSGTLLFLFIATSGWYSAGRSGTGYVVLKVVKMFNVFTFLPLRQFRSLPPSFTGLNRLHVGFAFTSIFVILVYLCYSCCVIFCVFSRSLNCGGVNRVLEEESTSIR